MMNDSSNKIWEKVVSAFVSNSRIKIAVSLLIAFTVYQLMIGYQCKNSEFVKTTAKEFTVAIIIDNKDKESEYANGVIIKNEADNYSVLTASHIFTSFAEDRDSVRNIQVITNDKESHNINFQSINKLDELLDASIFTFRSSNHYSSVKLGDEPRSGQLTYILGYKECANKTVENIEFNNGKIEEIASGGIDGYDVKYNHATISGMSGSPILDCKGNLIAIHGLSTKEKDGYKDWVKSECKKLDSDFRGDSYGIPVSKFRKYI